MISRHCCSTKVSQHSTQCWLATLANQNLYLSQQNSQKSKNIKSPLCELVPSRCRSHLWCWLRYQLRWLLHRLRHLWSLLRCRLWDWMWSSSCHLNLAHWTMQDLEAPGFWKRSISQSSKHIIKALRFNSKNPPLSLYVIMWNLGFENVICCWPVFFREQNAFPSRLGSGSMQPLNWIRHGECLHNASHEFPGESLNRWFAF